MRLRRASGAPSPSPASASPSSLAWRVRRGRREGVPHPLPEGLFTCLPSLLQRLGRSQEAQLLHEAREGHLRALVMCPLEHEGLLRVLRLAQGERQRVRVMRLLLVAPAAEAAAATAAPGRAPAWSAARKRTNANVAE